MTTGKIMFDPHATSHHINEGTPYTQSISIHTMVNPVEN